GLVLRLRRRVGQGEHARIVVGRDAAQGDLRHHRHAHGGALLRRLGLRSQGRAQPHAGPNRLRKGGPLDRYKIVKGWLDKDGKLHEKVYDVAWSGERKPDTTGKLPLVGNTVDVPNATWTNTIGAPELVAVWKDPAFDPTEPAFYYGRVIEIPTPRWTAYDAKRFGVKPLPGTAMTVTERAYTSPIWYTPTR